MAQNITQVGITAYLSFSVIFFIVCMFNDWSVLQYIIMFLVLTFIIQFIVNVWASAKLCNIDPNTMNVNLAKSFGYTLVPWLLIPVLVSVILYVMPGWVRVFSNTIGLAVVKSVYSELFSVKNDGSCASSGPVPGGPVPGGPVPGGPVKLGGAPEEMKISPEVIKQIYHDPSKLINEIEYVAGFEQWKKTIFDEYLKQLPYFCNETFFNEDDVYITVKDPTMTGGGDTKGPVKGETKGAEKGVPDKIKLTDPKIGKDDKEKETGVQPNGKRKVNTKSNIYQLYKCVSTKEKIGYFTWLLLTGTIFTLASLSQMYESDC